MTEFTQAAKQYETMTETEKEQFVDNVIESLMFADERVQETVIQILGRVDESLKKFLLKRLHF